MNKYEYIALVRTKALELYVQYFETYNDYLNWDHKDRVHKLYKRTDVED